MVNCAECGASAQPSTWWGSGVVCSKECLEKLAREEELGGATVRRRGPGQLEFVRELGNRCQLSTFTLTGAADG